MKKIYLLLLLLSCISYDMKSIIIIDAPEVNQSRYRWRNDDGNQATATWKAAENTAITLSSMDENLRLRLQFKNSPVSIGGEGTLSQNLQYSKDGGTTWTSVTMSTANDFVFASSTFVTHGAATTEQITTVVDGDFRPGVIVSNTTPDLSSTLFNWEKTENEFVIKPTTNVVPMITYLFRVTPQDLYTPANYAVLNTNCVVNIISTSSAEICSPGTVTISATASPGATIQWYDAPSGGTLLHTGGSFTTPSITTTTTYYVEAALGICTSTRVPVTAHVNLYTVETENDTICHEGILNLSAFATPATATIEWYADAALSTLVGTGNVFTTPTLTATTTYYAVAKSPACMTSGYPVTAVVHPRPDITISPEIDTVCIGSYASFTAEFVNSYSYLWSDGTTSNILTTNEPGFHHLTVENVLGCQTQYEVYLDTFTQITIDGFDYVPQIFTSPKTYSFTPIDPTAVTRYSWDFGDGNTSTEMSPTHTYAEFGDYIVTLKVYNDCDSTEASLHINVQAENTNVSNPDLERLINIYPNPATDIIQISNNASTEIQHVYIIHNNGSMVQQWAKPSLQQANMMIDVQQLPRGIYYIILVTKDRDIATKKITLL